MKWVAFTCKNYIDRNNGISYRILSYVADTYFFIFLCLIFLFPFFFLCIFSSLSFFLLLIVFFPVLLFFFFHFTLIINVLKYMFS